MGIFFKKKKIRLCKDNPLIFVLNCKNFNLTNGCLNVFKIVVLVFSGLEKFLLWHIDRTTSFSVSCADFK